MPAKAGIQTHRVRQRSVWLSEALGLDSRLRGDDKIVAYNSSRAKKI